MKVKAMPQKPSLDGKTLLTTIHSSSLLRMFLDSLNLQKHGLYCSPEEFQAIQNPFVLEMLYIISMDLMWPLDIKNILKNHDKRYLNVHVNENVSSELRNTIYNQFENLFVYFDKDITPFEVLMMMYITFVKTKVIGRNLKLPHLSTIVDPEEMGIIHFLRNAVVDSSKNTFGGDEDRYPFNLSDYGFEAFLQKLKTTVDQVDDTNSQVLFEETFKELTRDCKDRVEKELKKQAEKKKTQKKKKMGNMNHINSMSMSEKHTEGEDSTDDGSQEDDDNNDDESEEDFKGGYSSDDESQHKEHKDDNQSDNRLEELLEDSGDDNNDDIEEHNPGKIPGYKRHREVVEQPKDNPEPKKRKSNEDTLVEEDKTYEKNRQSVKNKSNSNSEITNVDSHADQMTMYVKSRPRRQTMSKNDNHHQETDTSSRVKKRKKEKKAYKQKKSNESDQVYTHRWNKETLQQSFKNCFKTMEKTETPMTTEKSEKVLLEDDGLIVRFDPTYTKMDNPLQTYTSLLIKMTQSKDGKTLSNLEMATLMAIAEDFKMTKTNDKTMSTNNYRKLLERHYQKDVIVLLDEDEKEEGDEKDEGDGKDEGDEEDDGDQKDEGDEKDEGDKEGVGDKEDDGDEKDEGDKEDEGDKAIEENKEDEGDKEDQG